MVNDFLRNNSNAFLQMGAGLLGGRTAPEQVSMGLQGFAGARQQQQQINKTAEILRRQGDADLAEAIEAGMMNGKDAWQMAFERKLQAQAPKKPPLMGAGGAIYNYETGQWLTPPNTGSGRDDRTSNMKELEAAGLVPGTPEYQQALLKLNAPKGTVIESDGAGGFRMVQGADVSGGANLNVEQGKNTGFLIRAQDANQTITQMESEGTSAWNKAMGAIPAGLGNYGLNDSAQKLNQAKRDFINAVLRQESGAVISPEEFANAEQQYFPQPGDSDAVIAQKRRNRENAISGFRIRSGPGAAAADQVGQQPRRYRFNPTTGELE